MWRMLNCLVAIEGMDGTGKTTAVARLHDLMLKMINPMPLFTRQPGGSRENSLSAKIYGLTEGEDKLTTWGRQFLHLSAHAELYENEIAPALRKHGTGVILDRCWMSTIAYGYYQGQLFGQLEYDEFEQIAQFPTQGIMPHVVFLFDTPWVKDPHNDAGLAGAYREIQKKYNYVVKVPPFYDPAKPGVEAAKWMLNKLLEERIVQIV